MVSIILWILLAGRLWVEDKIRVPTINIGIDYKKCSVLHQEHDKSGYLQEPEMEN